MRDWLLQLCKCPKENSAQRQVIALLVEVRKYFTFSPYISTTHNKSFSGYNVWLLCGVNGSCTNFSAFSMLKDGGWGNASFSWNTSFESTVSQYATGTNVSFKATPVCMWPPFVFIVFYGSQSDSMCWDVNGNITVCKCQPCRSIVT